MKKIILAVMVLLSGTAHSASTTTILGLTLPPYGAYRWDLPMNANSQILDSSVAVKAATQTFVGANLFTSTGNVYHGNGSALTGVITSTAAFVQKTGDTMTGGLLGTTANFSSSVTAGAGYYGNGATLTGVIKSSSTDNFLITVASATALKSDPAACDGGQYVTDIAADGTLTCGAPAGAGDMILTSTQSSTGQKTFSSVILSSATLPTRNKIIFGNELSNSSSTKLTTEYSTTSGFGPAVAGSTLTITTQGGTRVMVGFSGTIIESLANYTVGLTYYLDSVPYNGTHAITQGAQGSTAGYPQMASFAVMTDALSAGVHVFYLSLAPESGTATIAMPASYGPSQFWVYEIR